MVCARLTKMFGSVKANGATAAPDELTTQVRLKGVSKMQTLVKVGVGGAERHHTGRWPLVHKRISTSIKKSQAEPEECWPAGPSQSLSPTVEDEAGPQETGRVEKVWGRQREKGWASTIQKPHPQSKKKEKQRENIHNQRGSVTNGRLERCCYWHCWDVQEGYEPDDAGVKHSQNYFCNEDGAVVLTLFLAPWKYKDVRSILRPAKQNLKLRAGLTPVIRRTPSILAKTK